MNSSEIGTIGKCWRCGEKQVARASDRVIQDGVGICRPCEMQRWLKRKTWGIA